MNRDRRAGLTLIELIFGIAILAMLMVALQQAISVSTSAADDMARRQDLAMQGRRAMERLVHAVTETGAIVVPADSNAVARLKVEERILDLYVNATHAYAPAGDGVLDADNDSDFMINEDTYADPIDYVEYALVTGDSGNHKLVETRSNYATADLYDTVTGDALCEHVASFECRRLGPALVELRLILSDGKAEVSIRSCALARVLN